MNTKFPLLQIFYFLCAIHAHALVVDGSEGDPATGITTSPAQLNKVLSAGNLPAFPYWDHVISHSGATAVVMGINTENRLILASIRHTYPQRQFNWKGTSFTLVSTNENIGPNGLRLSTYQVTGNAALPVEILRAGHISTRTDTPAVGIKTLHIGTGLVRTEITLLNGELYYIGSPGAKTWGFNNISYSDSGILHTRFEIGTQYECQPLAGDSGGPLFTLKNNRWELSGIAGGASDPSKAKNRHKGTYPNTAETEFLSLQFQEVPVQKEETPGEWIVRNFGSSNPGWETDSDNDGASNRLEYLSGTNPLDSSDTWEVQTERGKNQTIIIQWKTIPGRNYLLETSMDMKTWTRDPRTFPGTGETLILEDDIGATTAKFYRAGIDLDPLAFNGNLPIFP